ncbi:triose-phosphate transporter family-domain-containing protein [Scenedesmus sp. NREL 46B-D3]|nr:triose-phosphate transporter family-domain-containing protein [Scenedesmus sp. NREL 46B-D3]
MFNKKLVGKKHGIFGNGGFPAPLLLTGVQFFFQHCLARLVFATGLVKRTGSPFTWQEWCKLVLPNGAVTGLDIGFSNASLVHITMSFYTMCKSTTPIFLLGFAFIWRLETPSWGLAGVVAVIVSGLLLLVQGEAEFDTTGFALVMSASCMSGLRFTLTQLLLHGSKGAAEGGRGSSDGGGHSPTPFGGPLEVLEVLTPVMSATTLLLSLATEQLWHVLPSSPYFNSAPHALVTALLILTGALIAFLMVWAEYQVIKETSALTFMIAGTVKEVVTVITAVIVFGDRFGVVNGVGLVIVIAGVLLFNWYKLQRLKQSVRQQIISRDDSLELDVAGGVPIHVVAAAHSSGSAVLGSPMRRDRDRDRLGNGEEHGVLMSKRRSSMEELEAQEVMKTLEFEPLLPWR